MLSKVFSAGLLGIDAYLVEVEVDIAMGLANWNTVGLPESTVRESRDRVIAAIRNSGYDFHRRRVTINLAPADIKKEGTAFDLPIALGLLASSEVIPLEGLKSYLVAGELSLHGEVKPVRGALSITMLAKQKKRRLLLPRANVAEASVVKGVEIYGVETLTDIVAFLTGERPLTAAFPAPLPPSETIPLPSVDFAEIKGQVHAKRALEIAAAGGHNIAMVGPPGSGKTMLAQRLPTILPPMSFEESLETTKIYSIAGQLNGQGPLIQQRPFRSPHHTISTAGLAGGGSTPRPGEISLAHNGILFLDELPEFKKDVLEILRQPLESGSVSIARAASTLSFPACFTLVASQNPCMCGFLGSPNQACTCTPSQIRRYHTRLSGPLLDRIDIHIEVPAVKFQELIDTKEGENSATIRARVLKARELQQRRFQKLKLHSNSQMAGRSIRKFCPIDSEGTRILEGAVNKLRLSARAFDRILKVARTISDLANSPEINPNHLAEAIQYRSLDRNYGATS